MISLLSNLLHVDLLHTTCTVSSPHNESYRRAPVQPLPTTRCHRISNGQRHDLCYMTPLRVQLEQPACRDTNNDLQEQSSGYRALANNAFSRLVFGTDTPQNIFRTFVNSFLLRLVGSDCSYSVYCNCTSLWPLSCTYAYEEKSPPACMYLHQPNPNPKTPTRRAQCTFNGEVCR